MAKLYDDDAINDEMKVFDMNNESDNEKTNEEQKPKRLMKESDKKSSTKAAARQSELSANKINRLV